MATADRSSGGVDASLHLVRHLSLAQARRIALVAQGFGRDRPTPVTVRHLQSEVNRLAQLQIDSVNVLQRAHYLPLYSRLGPYRCDLLDRSFGEAPRRLFEYWGHAASLIDIRLQPALRPRMARAASEAWPDLVRVQRENPDLVEQTYQAVAASPAGLTARQVEHPAAPRSRGWGWSWTATKTALEWLFRSGRVTSSRRTSGFERVYDLWERVLPPDVAQAPDLDPVEADLTLLRRAVRALGIGTESCFADYFRMSRAATRAALATMVRLGELEPVQVSGWSDRVYLDPTARRPRWVQGRGLVSPFDSLVFERRRLARLFGVDYRIEIYVPQPQRVYGYYVYLFLLGEQIVARVDLKSDRSARRLQVQASWREPDGPPGRLVARELAAELSLLADWLNLSTVTVAARGDLADDLAAALG